MDYTQYEMDNLGRGGLNDFFGEIESIKRDLMDYDDKIERIDALHRQQLNSTDAEQIDHISRQIDAQSDDARALANHLKVRIKDLQRKSTDETRRTHSDNVKRQFMSLIQKYTAIEATSRQKTRDVTARQVRIVQPDATDGEIEQFLETGQQQQIFASALMQNRRGEAQEALNAVQSRHAEIQQIERTMADLAQLFHDMEIMVAEQDTQIHHIDDHATQAQADIEQGVGHQEKAIVSAKKARKKKIICLVILIAIVVIIVVILAAYFGTR